MMHHRHGRPQPSARKAMLAASVLLGSLGTAMAGAADQPPAELKMILSPGQGRSDVITFSTDGEDQPATKESRPVETAEPTPMTVLPPEATAESAAEREALVSGKSRPRTKRESNRPSVSLGVGYRWDDLDWNIAGFGGSPNIRSELTFDEMESLVLSGNFRWRSESNLYFRGGVDIGTRLDGEVQDSDYDGNNRMFEFSRSYSEADGGSVLDASMGVGYLFEVPLQQQDMVFRVAPLLGYSYHRQDIEITDGWQVAYEPYYGVVFDPLLGLDSRYDAKWTGPWIGLDFELELNQRHSIQASLEYHWADYDADANWNLRSDLAHPVSFEHDSDGDGFVASLTYTNNFAPQWFWTLGANYSKFKADPGKNLMYFSNGYWLSTRLNEAEWESYAVTVGLGFKF